MFQILSINPDLTYTCGELGMSFGGRLPQVISTVITVIQIAVPILLIVFGMIDMGKAVMAQKEDDIKKGQQTLIKRVIAAVIVFFVITIVSMLISFLAGDDANITNCFNCFVNGAEGRDGCFRVAGGPTGP